MSEDIFTKMLTVVISGQQIYKYIFCFLYAYLYFLIFIQLVTISYISDACKSLSTVVAHILAQKWCPSSLSIQKTKQDIFCPFFLFLDEYLWRKSHEMKLIPPHKVHDRLPTPEPKVTAQRNGSLCAVIVLQRAAQPWESSVNLMIQQRKSK